MSRCQIATVWRGCVSSTEKAFDCLCLFLSSSFSVHLSLYMSFLSSSWLPKHIPKVAATPSTLRDFFSRRFKFQVGYKGKMHASPRELSFIWLSLSHNMFKRSNFWAIHLKFWQNTIEDLYGLGQVMTILILTQPPGKKSEWWPKRSNLLDDIFWNDSVVYLGCGPNGDSPNVIR